MGGKGGPMAFLAKKGWHPGSMRNQEKVWKREQEAAKEEKRLDELKKQYHEQRQREELDAVAVNAGVKLKQDRLDWMYKGGMVAKQDAEKRADEQLLGDRQVELKSVDDTSKAEELAQLPTFYTTDTPASANEIWQRLHSDPMFAIKQQEVLARKKIVSNPVQMDAIKKQIAEQQAAKAERKAAKKEAKAVRREAKAARKDKKKDKRERGASPEGGDERHDAKRRRHDSPEASRGNSGPRQNGHAHRNGGPGLQDERARERARERDGHGRERDGHGERVAHKREANGRGNDRGDEKHGAMRDGALAQGAGLTYGLNTAADALDVDREVKMRETETRLREAALKRAEEEKEKAKRYVRKEYKTGRMSEEERAARLAEMAGNAGAHEEARWARLQKARSRDEAAAGEEARAEEREGAAKPGEVSRFTKMATQEMLNHEATATLADRIGRRKYYSERGGGDESSFRR